MRYSTKKSGLSLQLLAGRTNFAVHHSLFELHIFKPTYLSGCSQMKRSGPPVYPAKLVVDFKNDLTKEQLAGIGAVSLAFNAAETLLDRAIAFALGLSSFMDNFVLAKIGSNEEKVKLLKIFFDVLSKQLTLDPSSIGAFHTTLDDFIALKNLRNASTHVTHIDAVSSVGMVTSKDGKPSRVLLTTEALDALYDRLVCINAELDLLCGVVDTGVRKMLIARAGMNPMRTAAEPEPQQWFAKLKTAQDHRKGLASMPEVP